MEALGPSSWVGRPRTRSYPLHGPPGWGVVFVQESVSAGLRRAPSDGGPLLSSWASAGRPRTPLVSDEGGGSVRGSRSVRPNHFFGGSFPDHRGVVRAPLSSFLLPALVTSRNCRDKGLRRDGASQDGVRERVVTGV